MGSEMDTFTARLASFDTVLKPERRRSSTTKSPKPVAWPHQKPSPAELAHAGFYYKPYETNPDNTTCFECGRALDGWEEEDNPVEEHLKHSPDCGWAIIVNIQQNSSNPATIEDPTSEKITQARLVTFGSAWPHDGKRGWVCQSEKMVAGGWYFCPTDESDDLASCPYCKLSLDGWEPKDDPFDEHYRRSSDCSFFVFAQPPTKKGKGSKAKKPRTSKASSRLSTQSVATTASEAPDMDIDEAMDQSIMSQSITKGKSTKKATKSKSKTAKSKKEDKETESQVEADSAQPGEPEPVKPKRAGRSKKRVSEEMADEAQNPDPSGEHEETPAEPPAKRRDTKTREISISEPPQADQLDYEMSDVPPEETVLQEEEPPKKSRKGAKKRASKMRKGSDASIVSASASKGHVPQDADLDAALEAGLEADEPEAPKYDVEAEPEPEQVQAPAPKKTKSSKKAKASSKPVEEDPTGLEEPAVDVEPPVEDKMDIENDDVDMVQEPPKTKSSKGSKKKGTKKSKKDDAKSKAPPIEEAHDSNEIPQDYEHEHHESFVSVEIPNRNSEAAEDPAHEPEPEQVVEPEEESPEKPAKKASRKDEKPKKSKKAKKQESSPPREPEPEPELQHEPEPMEEEIHTDLDPMSPSVDDDFGTPDELPDQVEIVTAAPSSPAPRESSAAKERTPVPPKTAKRFSDIPHEEHYADLVRQSLEPSDAHETEKKSSPTPALPPSQNSGARQSTPSMSPQSSDAENKPPSSRPSTSRQAVPSVTIEPQERTPLAAKTPSPSKRNFNGGFAASGHPWTPVDIDEALFGDRSDDKENADLSGLLKGIKGGLTSPEKKMSVEEWIHWNAKNGEERLKRECERLVGQFEKEGGRAMRRLEAIECLDS